MLFFMFMVYYVYMYVGACEVENTSSTHISCMIVCYSWFVEHGYGSFVVVLMQLEHLRKCVPTEAYPGCMHVCERMGETTLCTHAYTLLDARPHMSEHD